MSTSDAGANFGPSMMVSYIIEEQKADMKRIFGETCDSGHLTRRALEEKNKEHEEQSAPAVTGNPLEFYNAIRSRALPTKEPLVLSQKSIMPGDAQMDAEAAHGGKENREGINY